MQENEEIIKEEKIENDITNIEEESKPTNKKVTFFNFLLILAIFIGVLVYMVKVDGLDNMINILTKVDYKWVIGGLICLMINWMCETFTLYVPLKAMYPDQNFLKTIKVAMIGLLFNNLTPFATGGQPMQAYELAKAGRRVSDSLSAIIIKFVINQTALLVTTVVVVSFQFDFFKNLLQEYFWIAVFGISCNVIAIVAALIAGINKKIIIVIVTPIIKFLGKIHIIKHPEERLEKLYKSIDNFSEQFNFMKSKKRVVLKMFIAACIQSLAYYSITYMIYRAFGNNGVSFWQIVPVQAFLLLIMMFIPTPGSGLGAEGGFYMLFNSIFKEGTINMSILFWRMYTFYLPILVGLLFLIPIKRNNKKIKN